MGVDDGTDGCWLQEMSVVIQCLCIDLRSDGDTTELKTLEIIA